MKGIVLTLALLAVVTGGSVLAYGITRPSPGQSDCPETVVCPLTGEEVCQDRCPLSESKRQAQEQPFVCPVTGEQLRCEKCCPLTLNESQ